MDSVSLVTVRASSPILYNYWLLFGSTYLVDVTATDAAPVSLYVCTGVESICVNVSKLINIHVVPTKHSIELQNVFLTASHAMLHTVSRRAVSSSNFIACFNT
jgi:hypothetical protein